MRTLVFASLAVVGLGGAALAQGAGGRAAGGGT